MAEVREELDNQVKEGSVTAQENCKSSSQKLLFLGQPLLMASRLSL